MTSRQHRIRLSLSKMISFLVVVILTSSSLFSQQESVVLVHAGQVSGYGVAYGGPGTIITALHVVAGRKPITVMWQGKPFDAKIEKTYQPADLALLRLQGSSLPNIPPAKIYPGRPPMNTLLDFWVAPVRSARMDKKETKLEKSVPLEELHKRIENNPAAFARALCSNGGSNYPASSTRVFRFENPNIQKAHSGSPLTYDGFVVGMIDGGPPVNGKGSIWAIPAAGNFDRLMSEGSAVAIQGTCSSDRLYSGLRADNPHLDPKLNAIANELAESEEHPLTLVDANGNQLAFSLQYRALFKDIYDTMLDEDKKEIQDILQEEEDFDDGEVTLNDLFKQNIDVYQDDETGAVLAVPTGSEMGVEQRSGHTLVGVSSPRAGTEMLISVQTTPSVKQSVAAREWFKKFVMDDGRTWKKEFEDDVEDALNDPEDPYYDALMDRVAYGADGTSVVAELFLSLTIEENDFLGVAILVNDRDTLRKQERIYNYLMETCATLSGFVVY